MSDEYWTNFINGTGTDISYGVSTDGNKNIYTAGVSGIGHSNVHYTSSAIFGAIPPFSGYLIKYDPYGQPLWRNFVANTLSPATNIVISNAVATFQSTSVYVGGNTVGFGNIYDKDAVSSSFVPRNSGFLVKYDTDGNFQWRAFVSNTQSTINVTGACINSVAVDSSENVYAFGTTGSSATAIVNSNIYDSASSFPDATQTVVGFRHTAANNPIAYIIKFNSSGIFQWRAFLDFPGNSGIDISTSGTVDSNGDVIVAGHTGVAAIPQIYTSAITPTLSGLTIPINSAFLVKYDTNGGVKWRAFVDDNTATTGVDLAFGTAVDSLNNVYLVGRSGAGAAATIFNSNIYGTNASGITIPTSCAYIVKYGPTGNFLWRSYIDGTGVDISNSVTTDNERNVIVTGVTGTGIATIFDSTGRTSHNIPASSSFVVKFNENGNVLNRNFILSGTSGNSVMCDIDRNIITVGNTGTVNGFVYNSNVDSNCFTGYTIPASAAYIVKYKSDGVIPLPNGIYPTLVSNGWVVNWSNATSCISYGCFVSPSGENVYKVGGISGTAPSIISNADRAFSGYTIPASTGCVSKYDTNGNFQWRTYILGTSPNVTCVHGDNSSAYIGGTSGTANATLHDIYGNIIYTYPANAGFVVKYDSLGSIQLKSYVSNSIVNSIFYKSSSSDLYISGLTHPTFTSNIINNSDAVIGTAIAPNTGFLINLDVNFDLKWILRFKPSSGTSISPINSVSASTLDNSVYVAGNSNSIVSVNYTDSSATTATLLPAARANAAFVAKFTNLGAFQWKSYIDSLTVTSNELGTGVINEGSNVFFTGITGTGTASAYNNSDVIYGGFRPINITSAFLLKYDTSGNLIWYSNISTGTVTSNCVAVDSYGDVYIGGLGGASSNLSHSNIYGSVTTGITTVLNSAYVAKYNGLTGRAIWRNYLEGAGTDVTRSISIDSSNYIYTSGLAGSGASTVFNSNSVASALTVPLNSAFLVKYKPNGAIIF
jgi:hypothetical protein